MGFSFVTEIPSPDVIRERFPLAPELAARKKERDEEIKKIITGESDKLLVIVGPCSADNEEAVVDYVSRLVKVQEKTKDRLVIVPRVYTNKPRTTGEGYKGMLHQPAPTRPPTCWGASSPSGGCTCGSWRRPASPPPMRCSTPRTAAIWTTSSPTRPWRPLRGGPAAPAHRQRHGHPRGHEKPHQRRPVGDAQLHPGGPEQPQLPLPGWDVTTAGNPLAHAILRGGVDKYGTCVPNYHYEDLMRLWELYQKRGLSFPAAVVDANHSNSDKKYKEQPRIVSEVLHSRRHSSALHTLVKGDDRELPGGGLPAHRGGARYGKSITDPCLGWKDTERLLLEMAGRV